jgi:hypothetical protein
MKELRLYKQTLSVSVQDSLQLCKERDFVRHFMNHVEGKNEVDSFGNVDGIPATLDTFDSGFKSRAPDLASQLLKHPFLKVDSDDLSLRSDELCHLDGEEPGPTPDIENFHALLDMWSKYPSRILQPSPDPAIQCRSQFNRTYATGVRIHLCSRNGN